MGFGRSITGHAVRLGCGICDQALFAGSSFVFTLLLARWLPAAEFGAFAVAYSAFTLLQNAYDGLVSEPFAVLGSGRLHSHLRAYLGRLLMAHGAVSGAGAVLVAVAAAVSAGLGQPVLAAALWGGALATPFLCARSLLRQPFYVTRHIDRSLWVSGVHMGASVGALALAQAAGVLSAFTAFVCLAMGSAISSAVAVAMVRPTWRTGEASLGIAALLRCHMGYGRWALGERALLWLQTNIAFLLLPAVAGLDVSAAYRAANVLTMPAYMTMSSAANVLLPVLAGQGKGPVDPWQRRIPLIGAGLAAAYVVPLVVLGPPAARLLFGGRYDGWFGTPVLALMGGGVVLFAFQTGLELQLRAKLMIHRILVARGIATVATLTLGTALIVTGDMPGAIAALAVTWLATIAGLQIPGAMAGRLRTLVRRGRAAAGTAA